jgi:hypothetical protein
LGDYYSDGNISDAILARENIGVDIIIGAHTHRFFQQPRRYVNKGSVEKEQRLQKCQVSGMKMKFACAV